MESTINNPRIEKLQLQKEQMIQHSKQAESSEESKYYLCLADLYQLAIQHEKATMFGATITIEVGESTDAIQRVSIEVRPDFSKRTTHFEVSFSQWQAIPNKLLREVPEKKFDTAKEAYDAIVGLSENINRFFNTINF